MNSVWLLSAISAVAVFLVEGDPPIARPAPATDSKLEIRSYGTRPQPISKADLVIRNGVAYYFLSDSEDEVIIIEPGLSQVVFIDLDRKIQAVLTAKQLDDYLAKLYSATLADAERRDAGGSRAGKIAASMSRNLIDPQFKVLETADKHKLTLSNPCVEVSARYEDSTDRDQLMVIMNSLAAIEKIEAIRDPEEIPPFTRLTALRTVAGAGNRRPAEMTYLYRLAGPPRKMRWTYTVAPEVSERERNALIKLEAIRRHTRVVRFDQYDAEEEEPKQK